MAGSSKGLSGYEQIAFRTPTMGIESATYEGNSHRDESNQIALKDTRWLPLGTPAQSDG